MSYLPVFGTKRVFPVCLDVEYVGYVEKKLQQKCRQKSSKTRMTINVPQHENLLASDKTAKRFFTCTDEVTVRLLIPWSEQARVEDGLLPQTEGDAVHAGGRVVDARVTRPHEATLQHALRNEHDHESVRSVSPSSAARRTRIMGYTPCVPAPYRHCLLDIQFTSHTLKISYYRKSKYNHSATFPNQII